MPVEPTSRQLPIGGPYRYVRNPLYLAWVTACDGPADLDASLSPIRDPRAYPQLFAPLGLLEPVSPYADCPAVLARALTAGADAAKQNMETALKAGGLAPVVNGWTLTFHMFDYNLDHLGPGTIDDPAWRIGDRDASYLARALAARGGLWGNHGYEAAYPMTYTDADGRAAELTHPSDANQTRAFPQPVESAGSGT